MIRRAGKLNHCTIDSKYGSRSDGHSRYLSIIFRSLDRAASGELKASEDVGDDVDVVGTSRTSINLNASSFSIKKMPSDEAVDVIFLSTFRTD